MYKDFAKPFGEDFGIDFTSMFDKADWLSEVEVVIKGIVFGNREDSSFFPLFWDVIIR